MTAPKTEDFDSYAENYHEALHKGLAASGETRDYFSRQRLSFCAKQLARRGVVPRFVLDYGCGDGSSTPDFLATFPSVSLVGVDVSERSLAQARKRYGSAVASFFPVAACHLDGEIDFALANGIFHHIDPAQHAQAARWMFRALRPGGWLAFCENNPWSPAARYVMSRIPFDRDAIMVWPAQARALLRSVGFCVARTDYLFLFPRSLRFLRWLEGPLGKAPLGAQYIVLCQKPEGT